jgi:hypothetical protein
MQCNKIRKGRYELFKYDSLEELYEIVDKCK